MVHPKNQTSGPHRGVFAGCVASAFSLRNVLSQPRIIALCWPLLLFLKQSVENIKNFFSFLKFLPLFSLLENSSWNWWWFVSEDSKRFLFARALGAQVNRCDHCWFLLENGFLYTSSTYSGLPGHALLFQNTQLPCLWLSSMARLKREDHNGGRGGFPPHCPSPSG